MGQPGAAMSKSHNYLGFTTLASETRSRATHSWHNQGMEFTVHHFG
jgi:hypothetical protein